MQKRLICLLTVLCLFCLSSCESDSQTKRKTPGEDYHITSLYSEGEKNAVTLDFVMDHDEYAVEGDITLTGSLGIAYMQEGKSVPNQYAHLVINTDDTRWEFDDGKCTLNSKTIYEEIIPDIGTNDLYAGEIEAPFEDSFRALPTHRRDLELHFEEGSYRGSISVTISIYERTSTGEYDTTGKVIRSTTIDVFYNKSDGKIIFN